LIEDAPTCQILLDRIIDEAVDVMTRRLNSMVVLEARA